MQVLRTTLDILSLRFKCYANNSFTVFRVLRYHFQNLLSTYHIYEYKTINFDFLNLWTERT